MRTPESRKQKNKSWWLLQTVLALVAFAAYVACFHQARDTLQDGCPRRRDDGGNKLKTNWRLIVAQTRHRHRFGLGVIFVILYLVLPFSWSAVLPHEGNFPAIWGRYGDPSWGKRRIDRGAPDRRGKQWYAILLILSIAKAFFFRFFTAWFRVKAWFKLSIIAIEWGRYGYLIPWQRKAVSCCHDVISLFWRVDPGRRLGFPVLWGASLIGGEVFCALCSIPHIPSAWRGFGIPAWDLNKRSDKRMVACLTTKTKKCCFKFRPNEVESMTRQCRIMLLSSTIYAESSQKWYLLLRNGMCTLQFPKRNMRDLAGLLIIRVRLRTQLSEIKEQTRGWNTATFGSLFYSPQFSKFSFGCVMDQLEIWVLMAARWIFIFVVIVRHCNRNSM